MPKEALNYVATLVIVNQNPTPFDSLVHLRFNEPIGEVLPAVVKQVKGLMELYD